MNSASDLREGLKIQLDPRSGVPVYRQIMNKVLSEMATGRLNTGDQLPTVRQLAVDLSINPNTVIRAYRELEIRGFLDTQQGAGTFISAQPVEQDDAERQRNLDLIVNDSIARAGAEGFTARQVLDRLSELLGKQKAKKEMEQ